MRIAQQLRTHLTRRIRFLHENADRLVMYIEKADIIAGASPHLNHKNYFPLTIGVLDFTGDPSTITTAIIEFMTLYQPEIMQNLDLASQAIKLNAEFLDTDRYDLSYQVTLRETVVVQIDTTCETDERYQISYPPSAYDPTLLPSQHNPVEDLNNGLTALKWSPEAMKALNGN